MVRLVVCVTSPVWLTCSLGTYLVRKAKGPMSASRDTYFVSTFTVKSSRTVQTNDTTTRRVT